MGDQPFKAEDLLPEGLPQGWKVEIRVRKTGKRDRVVSEKKELVKSDGMKKLCLALAAKGQDSGGEASKRKAAGTPDSKETAKKRNSSRSPAMRGSRSSKKREPNTPFFILDPDKREDSDTVDIPNLQEIIDSARKEKEGHKTVYVSAPTIGSLLGGQQSETRSIQDYNRSRLPKFALNICQHINIGPANLPSVPSQFHVNKQGWGSKNMMGKPYQYAPPLEKPNRPVVETKPKEDPEGALFGDLFTDPCIEFAVKTLTGSMPPVGGDGAVDDYLFQQLDSSVILKNPCQN